MTSTSSRPSSRLTRSITSAGDEVARAAVEADRQRLAGGVVADQAVEQADREVVERFPAEVLERAQRGGLAGTEHAGDEQDALPFVGDSTPSPALCRHSTLMTVAPRSASHIAATGPAMSCPKSSTVRPESALPSMSERSSLSLASLLSCLAAAAQSSNYFQLLSFLEETMRDLPPLNALAVFEIVARTGSVRRAADELAVTPRRGEQATPLA